MSKKVSGVQHHPIPSCPNCGGNQCPVYQGAEHAENSVTRRRRCRRCGNTFKTVAQVRQGGYVGPEQVKVDTPAPVNAGARGSAPADGQKKT